MRRPDPATLARALARTLGPDPVVEDLRRLSGGASRETWALDARSADGVVHPLVLRRDPGSAIGSTDRATEHALLAAAHDQGVPVPAVRLLLEPGDELGDGFVMDRIEGETIPRRILRDEQYAPARELLAAQCGRIAAAVHRIDPGALPRLAHLGASEQLAQYRSLLDAFGEPHPAFELALRDLAHRLPPPPPAPRLVHGDFRNGNLIVGAEGVRAVLDWELAHLGDPVEDLGWMCVRSWRFGELDRVVGGFGTLDDLLDAYAAAGGGVVDPEHVRFWTTLGTVKWGVICIAQAFTHLGGTVRSVELATLGRRVAETEWDLLELLDGGW